MKMMCPNCKVEMLEDFELIKYGNGAGYISVSKVNGGSSFSYQVRACLCPKCGKLELYAYNPPSNKNIKPHDYRNLY